ncbi:MAG TPA: hypothetical protein VND93_08710 [Myxococcales bacterium]|nr:hypothetical protein [Myxococcales bacterium]
MTSEPDPSTAAARPLAQAVRDGASQLAAWGLKLPPDASRLRQLVHGVWLPVVVARAVLADARVRGRWLRYSLGQAAITVVVAVLVLGGGRSASGGDGQVADAAERAVAELRDRVDQRAGALADRAKSERSGELIRAQQELIEERLERASGHVQAAVGRGMEPREALRHQVERALDDAALERAAATHARIADAAEHLDGERLRANLESKVREVLEGPAQASLEEARRIDPRRLEEEIRAGTAKAAKTAKAPEDGEEQEGDLVAELLEGVASPGRGVAAIPPEQAARSREIRRELKAAALAGVPEAEARLASAMPWWTRMGLPGVPARAVGWLVALWGSLSGVQLVVIALCRDYHAELSREAFLLTGLAPEDPPGRPQPRFNLQWVRTRVRRRIRGWLVVALGIPVCWAIGLVFPGDWARNVLAGGWVLYWQVVFAASKSQRAWVDEGVAPPPWFIRGWRWMVARILPVRLVGAGVYGDLWERCTRSLYAPAECVEQQPAAFTGLMLFRLAGSAPLVKIFTRPLVPVASALLLEAYRERHPARTVPEILPAMPVPALGYTAPDARQAIPR